MAKQEKKDEKPAPVTSTYYATHDKDGWHVMRLDVYPGSRFEASEVMRHPHMLVASERLRVLLERVLP